MAHSEPHRYCPYCGGPLETRSLKPGEPKRLVCTVCGRADYLDPKLVACTVLRVDDERIVLLRRSMQPQAGKWVMPGGYVDRGETVEHAALREAMEECGLEVRLCDLLGVYSYPGHTEVIVVYTADRVGGEVYAGDESDAFQLVRPEEIPWSDLAFQSTHDALTDYCKREGIGGPNREGAGDEGRHGIFRDGI
ncbi:MAG: NUDIX hydrolase [Desulfobacteraceae bacterium]